MQKVITINLNGNAYQLEEAAYESLHAYLDRAEVQLKDNPDRTEIMADLEQAIAEKCQKFLSPSKTVVIAAEMEHIVREMGPVERADDDAPPHTGDERSSGQTTDAGVRPSKRFYRIREGSIIAGVCTGVAAYFGIDVTVVRIIVGILALVTVGWALLGYWMVAMIAPEATTSEERAAAHGQPPFNAREIIDQARKTAADFKSRAESSRDAWKRHWREQQHQWRVQQREWKRQWRQRVRTERWSAAGTPPRSAPPVPPLTVDYTARVWAGVLVPILSILSVAFFVALVASVVSLVNTGALYGWPLPQGVPLWAGILILVGLFQVVSAPIRAARHASYYVWGRPYAWFAVWEGLFGTAVTILVIWLLYRHMPPVQDFREFMQNLPDAFRGLGQDVKMWIQLVIEELK
jgi:phage shock protein PspC (stress-responsive transcriptional regulator)